MPKRVHRLPRHGTTERYRRRCRCHPCTRAWRIYRAVVSDYPSVKRPAEVLTDPNGPAFWRLAALAFTPEQRPWIQRRALARQQRTDAVQSIAAVEISRMSTRQIEALMQSEIPSSAQTRRCRGPAQLVA